MITLVHLLNMSDAPQEIEKWLECDEIRRIIVLINGSVDSDFLRCIGNESRIVLELAKDDLPQQIDRLCKQDAVDDEVLFVEGGMSMDVRSIKALQESLHRSEKNGIALPRHDFNSILSVAKNDEADVKLGFNELSRSLPQYHRVYSNDISCAMVKWDVFSLLWDQCDFEGFFTLYYILQNFCFYVSDYGYSTVACNNSLLRVNGWEVVSNHSQQKRLEKNYPYMAHLHHMYRRFEIHAVDYFSELICKTTRRKKLLIDLFWVKPCYNGTGEYGISLLHSFVKAYSSEYDVFALIDEESDRFHGITASGIETVREGSTDRLYDIAIVTFQLIDKDHQIYLNKNALRIVYCMLDMIMLRCNYLTINVGDLDACFRLSFKLSDGIVFISDSTKRDVLEYFLDDHDLPRLMTKTIRPAPKMNPCEPSSVDLPFERFILVMGNSYKHKLLKETLEALRNSPDNFIFVGYGDKQYFHANVYGFGSGNLSNEQLSSMYHKCDMLIFPSCYEGFGLPIYEALTANKPILLFDNGMNREVASFLPEFAAHFHFYRSFREIESCIDDIRRKTYTAKKISWDWGLHAKELEAFLQTIVENDIDIEKLEERWRLFNLLEYTKIMENITNAGAVRSSEAFRSYIVLKSFLARKLPFFYKILAYWFSRMRKE